MSGFSDALGESKIAALDLASNYDELGKFIRVKLNEEFKTFGLELTKFVIENISLPQEVEAAMDKRTSMGVIGDVGRYAQFQAADAMRDAAQNPGGGAGTGVGLGAGFALGNAMAGAMSDAMKSQEGGGGGAAAPAGVACPRVVTRTHLARSSARSVVPSRERPQVRELSGGAESRREVLQRVRSEGLRHQPQISRMNTD